MLERIKQVIWRQPALIRVSMLGATLSIICVLALAQLTFLPGVNRLKLTEKGATINFTASRWIVANHDDCIRLSWRVENTREVHVNGNGRVGEDSTEFCVDSPGESADIRVVFQDETQETYELYIPLMLYTPIVWGWIWLGTFSAIVALLALIIWSLSQFRLIRWALQTLLFLVVSLPVTALVIEFGFRGYIQENGTFRERNTLLLSTSELIDRATLRTVPFLNYGLVPLEGSDVNQLGYRDTEELAFPKPSDTIRIVVLGDSATYGYALRADQTQPAYLEVILRQDYGYDSVEVINTGVIGYDSFHYVVNLAFRIPELEPDLVIVAMNIVDNSHRIETPECYRGETYYRGFPSSSRMYNVEDFEFNPSALFRFVALNQGWIENPLTQSTIRDFVQCEVPEDMTNIDLLALNPPIYYERNMRSLVGLANMHAMPILLSTTPISAKAESEDDVWVINALEEQNEILKSIAAEHNIPLIDFTQTELHGSDDLWIEYLHLTSEGTRLQAELYADYIIENDLLFPVEPG